MKIPPNFAYLIFINNTGSGLASSFYSHLLKSLWTHQGPMGCWSSNKNLIANSARNEGATRNQQSDVLWLQWYLNTTVGVGPYSMSVWCQPVSHTHCEVIYLTSERGWGQVRVRLALEHEPELDLSQPGNQVTVMIIVIIFNFTVTGRSKLK